MPVFAPGTVHSPETLQPYMVVSSLYRLLQAVRIHQDANRLVVSCANDFLRDIRQALAAEDEISFQFSRGWLFFQGEKVPYRQETANLIHNLLNLFGRLGVSGIRFRKNLIEVHSSSLMAFFRKFAKLAQQEMTFEQLQEQLLPTEFDWVDLLEEPEEIHAELSPDKREQGLRTYSAAMDTLEDIGEKVSSRKRAGVRRIIRVIQKMVDLIIEDERVLMGLSTLRDHDDSIYSHSINVSILAMTLGFRIGLSRQAVQRLGICGMFFDLGKVSIPKEILHKSSGLSEDEINLIHQHPHVGVSQIVRLVSSREMKVNSLLSSFEHHLKYDRSGYPKTSWQRPLSLFGRILAIADVFVALTSYRPYRPYAFSPDCAIGIMLEGLGKEFDPVLLKVFASMQGVYPVGTLLQIDSGELALVVDSPSGGLADRPMVLLLQADGKGGFEKKETIDLAERDKDKGGFRRNIISSMHPSAYGIQPMQYIF